MCGKQLADNRCGLMILPLLSYVTEQVTARTGTRIRYDHCLLTCANWTVFSVGVYFPFTTSKLFQTPFHFIHLDRNPSPFKFPSTHPSASAKTRGKNPFAKCSSAPSRASALTWSCMSSPSTSFAL
uniref:Uncharacterized protein n=1 Tax=Opuntia streptacantha TaxID=393608 RepID=A0A7C9CX20_OPUST